MEPTNPIIAATHRDPYPYYKRLLEGPPLYFDDELNLWVAARAPIVAEVFDSLVCRVRPTTDPVPKVLKGLPVGEVFAHLVRMNDGRRHDQPKLALQRALAAIPAVDVQAVTRNAAMRAVPTCPDSTALNAWMMNTSLEVVVDLLGFSPETRHAIVNWTRQFVACLSPLSTTEEMAAASAATAALRHSMQALLDSTEDDAQSLISRVRNEAPRLGWSDPDSLIANLIGLLSQTYEATAGLIGNAIVALTRYPTLLAEARSRRDGWNQLVHETSRYDSPVQNTRRFVDQTVTIGGVDLPSGAIVLLVLAAANRDPQQNFEPDNFLLECADRRVFSFSRGTHVCPGELLARTIAATALSILFSAMPNGAIASFTWLYKPSTNARIPLFTDHTRAGRL